MPAVPARLRRETGAALLAGVIRDYPLSYYMTLAYARLAEKDRARADATLQEAILREPTHEAPVAVSPVFASERFRRAVLLSEQGDWKLVRAELDHLGVSTGSAPPEIVWASAFLLAKAGAPAHSHRVMRAFASAALGAIATSAGANGSSPDKASTAIVDWFDHYPIGPWRSGWELAYPRPFASIVASEAARSQVPEALAFAIMREESAFEPGVVSGAGAVGLMQLIVPTAKRMAKPLGLPWNAHALTRPEINVALGCRYLAALRAKFQDNVLLAIPGYNAGGGAPQKWLQSRPTEDFDLWVERIPYEETRLYTKRVITSLAAYEFLYAPERPSEALRTPLPASPSLRSVVASTSPNEG